jgi:hypothetical protein
MRETLTKMWKISEKKNQREILEIKISLNKIQLKGTPAHYNMWKTEFRGWRQNRY